MASASRHLFFRSFVVATFRFHKMKMKFPCNNFKIHIFESINHYVLFCITVIY
jgi:hypothetical protein